MNNKFNKKIFFRCSPAVRDKIQEEAKKDGRSMSYIIRRIVDKFFDDRDRLIALNDSEK